MTPPRTRGPLWSLDEYIVVADLYLRRGRSSGDSDPEVIRLAQLTGRTPASISYRIGNYHGTAHPGAGLKPVTGEALAIFTTMAADPAERERLTLEATRRLTRGLPPAPVLLPTGAARLTEPEHMHTLETEAELAARVHTITRAEAQLVTRYLNWIDSGRRRFKSVLIPTDDASLRADLYDPKRDLLIEAKASNSREHIRYAVGQLFDYRRRIDPRPRHLAILVPSKPAPDMLDLLAELGIGAIWRDRSQFVEELPPPATASSKNLDLDRGSQ